MGWQSPDLPSHLFACSFEKQLRVMRNFQFLDLTCCKLQVYNVFLEKDVGN